MKSSLTFASIVYLVTFLTVNLNAQQAVVSSGGDIISGSGTMSYTIGESVYTTVGGAPGSMKQGVQQPDINVSLSIRVLLSGPYNSTTGLMNDQLRSGMLLPPSEPYSNSPFNKPAILELNNETLPAGVFANNSPDAIVDWVFLELRHASNPNLILATKRALLQRDGDVVSHIDAASPVVFTRLSSGNYYVCIKHRNHLGVMTASPVSLTQGAVSIDFTTMPTVYLKAGLIQPPRRIEGLVYTLWPGDANFNKNVKFNGLSNDKNEIFNAVGGAANLNASIDNIYRVEDVNLDGMIRYNGMNNDRAVIINALGITTPNKVLSQHTPD